MVNVIGLGYIGLPTALMLASHGIEVIGTDYNEKLIDTLKKGRTTFQEKGLEELFRRALEKGITFFQFLSSNRLLYYFRSDTL